MASRWLETGYMYAGPPLQYVEAKGKASRHREFSCRAVLCSIHLAVVSHIFARAMVTASASLTAQAREP
eukprot:111253-Prymnesium_polylepis.2